MDSFEYQANEHFDDEMFVISQNALHYSSIEGDCNMTGYFPPASEACSYNYSGISPGQDVGYFAHSEAPNSTSTANHQGNFLLNDGDFHMQQELTPFDLHGGHEVLPELSSLTIADSGSSSTAASIPTTTSRRRQKQLKRSAKHTTTPRAKRPRMKVSTDASKHQPPIQISTYSGTKKDFEDKILVDLRAKGVQYADIMKVYDFGITNTSLRGRIRALTKPASELVRVKIWLPRDIELLLEAVPMFRRPTGKPKVFWDKVGLYILENGGSRKFCGKLCHAKYTSVTGLHF